MLRNLSTTSSSGYGICGTPLVGVLASDMPTGFSLPGLLNNDVDANDPAGCLYRTEILTWPSSGTLSVDENGAFSFTGAADGTYSGTERVYKNGAVAYDTTYGFTVGAVTATLTAAPSVQHSVSTTAVVTTTPRVAGTVNLAGSGCVQHATSSALAITVTARIAGVVNLIASSVTQHATSSTGIVTRVAKIINLIAAACTQRASSTTAVVTRTPRAALTMVGGITVNSTGQTSVTISWQAATGNVAGYEYDVDNVPNYIQVGNVLSVTISGLTPATQHPIQVRAYDAIGNKATPLTTTITTNDSAPSNPTYTPSAARTVGVQAASRSFTGGKFWDLSDTRKPRGVKDPDSTIDITFDWSDWLADIGNANIASATFILDGLDSNASYESNGKATVFVSGGVTGTATITCRISTDSTPVRIDDRTVYIDVEDE